MAATAPSSSGLTYTTSAPADPKMDLLKELRSHEVAIAELNNLPSSRKSISHNVCASSCSDPGPNLEAISLSKLSSNLEQLLVYSDCDYSDADIIVEGIPVGVHRCILASRSKFFHELFKSEKESHEKEGKLKYVMSDLLPYGKVGYEAFRIFLGYLYTGKLKPSPMEVSTCVDDECGHDACRPAINFAVELVYASSIFQVPELSSLFEPRLLYFVKKALVEDVIPILIVAIDCDLSQLVAQCVDRVARSDLDFVSIEKEVPPEHSEKIKLLWCSSQHDVEVEIGRLPHWSEVLYKFMEDDLPDSSYLENGSPEEQEIKWRLLKELEDDFRKALQG